MCIRDRSTISATATAEAKQVWGYIVYGNGASAVSYTHLDVYKRQLYMSAKTKIDSSSKTWDDGFAGTQRINFGGKADIANMKNFVSFKAEGTAKVKIYWVEGGTDNQMCIRDRFKRYNRNS